MIHMYMNTKKSLQKAIARSLPSVVDAFEELKAATTGKRKTNCFRDFKNRFKDAKRSFMSEQSSIQSAAESLQTSRHEQGI